MTPGIMSPQCTRVGNNHRRIVKQHRPKTSNVRSISKFFVILYGLVVLYGFLVVRQLHVQVISAGVESSENSLPQPMTAQLGEKLDIPPVAGTSIEEFHSSEQGSFHRFRNYPASRLQLGPAHDSSFDFDKILDPRDPMLIPGAGWDVSPIVVTKFKLLFFTTPKIGTTVFKQLFRRMMGLPDWFVDSEPNLPHNPQQNGLMYFYDCAPQLQREIFNPAFNWTRAVFVRDPLERLVSAYLDKVVRNNGTYVKRHCCGIKKPPQRGDVHNEMVQNMETEKRRVQAEQQLRQEQLLAGKGGDGRMTALLANSLGSTNKDHRRLTDQAMGTTSKNASYFKEPEERAWRRGGGVSLGPLSVPQGQPIPDICANLTVDEDPHLSFEDFIRQVLPRCSIDPHWVPQSQKFRKPALWKSINFVGHFETLREDTERLLKDIGAWDEYGRAGWPPGGPIFASNMARHKTEAHYSWKEYYRGPGLTDLARGFYKEDYSDQYLGELGMPSLSYEAEDG